MTVEIRPLEKESMPDTMTVNDAEYRVVKLLGKGKGGYSYLVTDGTAQYVLKQIHHEPCAYYAFGDKLRSELRDYETLRKLCFPDRRFRRRYTSICRSASARFDSVFPGPLPAPLQRKPVFLLGGCSGAREDYASG